MLMAALEHLRNNDKPLVAEVRAPAEIGGIASGEATQRICIRDIGMNVHAMGPFFGHGRPFRHEPFLLSSTQEPITQAVVFAGATPDQTTMVQKRLNPLISTIAKDVQFRSAQGNGEHVGWETLTTEPFTVQVPNGEVSSSAIEHHGFTLKLVESSPENAGAILACLASEVLLGVDRNMGKNGFPVLLFGHLHRSKIIAPLHLSNVVPTSQQGSLKNIDNKIRERQRQDDKRVGIVPLDETSELDFWSLEIAGRHGDEAWKNALDRLRQKQWLSAQEKTIGS